MSFCPAYWDMLDRHIADGSIFITDLVYEELTRGESEVTDWIKARKDSGMIKEFYDDEVQKEYSKIVDYVKQEYPKEEVVADFLRGADPWLIAVCKVHEIVLVSKEILEIPRKKYIYQISVKYLVLNILMSLR